MFRIKLKIMLIPHPRKYRHLNEKTINNKILNESQYRDESDIGTT
jgi:hypothetical protein